MEVIDVFNLFNPDDSAFEGNLPLDTIHPSKEAIDVAFYWDAKIILELNYIKSDKSTYLSKDGTTKGCIWFEGQYYIFKDDI